jgi:hypothetical protein
MPGIPRELIEHELHLNSKAKPVKQWLRHFAQDKEDVIKRETTRLLYAVSLKKCTTWIGSPILFLYLKGIHIGWYVLIIHILTRHAKKAPRPTAAFYVSFCYLGYHQIPLKEEDQVKTSFITPFDAFCYTTMSFGHKSIGATYQRGIKQCLHSQLAHNAEAHVDNVVVKTREDEGLISDLVETFDNLRKFKMKLNPEKCTFSVPSGKLLGYMVSHRGIDPNPEKVSTITKMKPPESLHDV